MNTKNINIKLFYLSGIEKMIYIYEKYFKHPLCVTVVIDCIFSINF